ncbi:MAG: ABC transporter permease subunit [Caldilineaceae bacterium]|nr:ABC transporter permease subunit [Caldilineaceae bacterium]
MVMIKSPVASVALTIILVPVGVLVGGALASGLSAVGALISANLAATISGVIVLPAAALGGVRWAVPQKETRPASSRTRMLRMGVLLLASLCVLLALYLFGYLVVAAGQTLAPQLASFRFMGDFFANLGGIMLLSLQPACAVIGAGILASIGGRVGNIVAGRVPAGTLKVINIVLCLVAGVVLGLLIGLAVEWLYQLRRPYITFVAPAVIGGVLGLAVGVRAPAASLLPIGLSVYSVTRTILNALRAVEALIMVIIFAVWVGIGPFAGVLALGLHTVAALAKLYSEQVESISAGPLEAVLATGANRMQMVVYAVIPQIVPPYISFTMYRWDINVRMSTIIGFAGGGGIGFLLQQNINLLNYRAASAQIFAIAIVVSVMDYVSSALRQRAV